MKDIGNLWVIAVYDTERVYGGPEEGGWWYTQGTLVGISDVGGFKYVSNAASACRAVNERLGYDNRGDWHHEQRREAHLVELGRRELHPELRRQECHADIDPGPEDYVIRWDVPAEFPEHRPHYC